MLFMRGFDFDWVWAREEMPVERYADLGGEAEKMEDIVIVIIAAGVRWWC